MTCGFGVRRRRLLASSSATSAAVPAVYLYNLEDLELVLILLYFSAMSVTLPAIAHEKCVISVNLNDCCIFLELVILWIRRSSRQTLHPLARDNSQISLSQTETVLECKTSVK